MSPVTVWLALSTISSNCATKVSMSSTLGYGGMAMSPAQPLSVQNLYCSQAWRAVSMT